MKKISREDYRKMGVSNKLAAPLLMVFFIALYS